MQMKDEGLENKDNNHGNITGRDAITGKNLNDTGLSSTFKSIELPPKEYEQ